MANERRATPRRRRNGLWSAGEAPGVLTFQIQEVGLLLVTRKGHEDGEALLRRFNKMVQRDGVLQEARRRRSFISNRERQRLAERRATRRRQRQAMKLASRR